MRLPRDLGGFELAKLLSRFGYEITRQKGSHLRLRSLYRGVEHHITIPAHRQLKLGTLNAVITEVSGYLEMPRADVERSLFGS